MSRDAFHRSGIESESDALNPYGIGRLSSSSDTATKTEKKIWFLFAVLALLVLGITAAGLYVYFSDFTPLKSQVGHLGMTDLDSLTERLSNLESSVLALNQRLSALDSSVKSDNQRISNLETNLTFDDQRISSLEANVTAADERISSLETNVTLQNTRLSAQEQRLLLVESTLNQSLVALENSVASQNQSLSVTQQIVNSIPDFHCATWDVLSPDTPYMLRYAPFVSATNQSKIVSPAPPPRHEYQQNTTCVRIKG